MLFFRDWYYGPTAPIRIGPQPIWLSNTRIRADARNLAHILKRIKNDERSHPVFMEFLSELYEGVDDIGFAEAEDYLFFFVIENGRKVLASRISDGTLRYLALLAVLCDPEPPSLICLEEPEMGLHPDLIQVIAKAIRYASERTQIIATTHSVSLVDNFTDSPESIVVCEKLDGSTELRRLDPDEMKPWIEKYRLGNLWTSGQIGGNRW
jgi:predicted ATPase